MRRGIKEGIININLAFGVLALFLSLSQWLLYLKVLSISSVKASAAYLLEAATCFNGYTFTSLFRTIYLYTVAPTKQLDFGGGLNSHVPFSRSRGIKNGSHFLAFPSARWENEFAFYYFGKDSKWAPTEFHKKPSNR